MKRFIINLILIIICFLLQTTVLKYAALAGVIPNLLLILTVSVGYMRGRNEAMAVGMICGLLTDMMYGNIIGLYAVAFLLIGYLNGLVHKYYYHDDFTVPILLVGISDFLYNFFVYVTEFLLRNRLALSVYMKQIILPEVIYTLLVSVVLYKALHSLNGFLYRFEKEEE